MEPFLGPGDGAMGTDGLYWRDGALISVQPRLARVLRLRLSADREALEGVDTLAAQHPDFAYPTTGALVDGHLILVSTSYANVLRRPDVAAQHGDVLIHAISLIPR
jgi:hypothetical protein